jgi:hypothetical protein
VGQEIPKANINSYEGVSMLTRIITIALAASSLAFATAHAQTGSSTGTGTTSGTGTSSGSTMSPSTSGSTGSGQIAQQPSGSFKASNYNTKSECLTAAKAAGAPSTACNSLP